MAGNGRLYAAPCQASKVLEIDPAAGTTRLIGDEIPGGNKLSYRSLAAASNGRLYAAPYGTPRVLEINPATGSTRLIGDTLPEAESYSSVAAASNGRLYAAPCGGSCILEIDLFELQKSWLVLLRQIGTLQGQVRRGLLEQLTVDPGVWALAQFEDMVLQTTILAFL